MAGFISMGTGCYGYVDDGPPPAYAEGYEPEYYDGHIVYYDDVGRPFYYGAGAVVWIPPTAPLYGVYVSHWHHYGPAYRNWNTHYGYRYHGYHARVHRR
ncbi:MAG TPA: hypothetical protein VGM06_14130 [Polyangiaceae bacterium]